VCTLEPTKKKSLLHPDVYFFFCILLFNVIFQVENFEAWVNDTKFRIMRPNTMNKYGAVLDDFGLETMLDKLMDGFIRPISKGDTFVLILDKLYHMFTRRFFFFLF
jgi:hypothetical protein